MIGGETDVVKRLDRFSKRCRPGRGNVDRTPGRDKGAWHRRGRLSSLAPVPALATRQDVHKTASSMA